ncbi:MAG: tetratricopeptide repeat protein [Anaerolineae bacterium]|nr:tetratricopeptide repeat protein [Anaerolineae bacterium]
MEKPVAPTKWGSSPTAQDLYAVFADLAVRERDEKALRQYAPLAEEMAVRAGHPLYQAIAHRAWGMAHRLVGEYAEAEERLTQALASFQKLATRWQMGRTLCEFAELALAQGDTGAARDYHTRALTLFEEMRAAPDAARTRAALSGG